MYITIHIMK